MTGASPADARHSAPRLAVRGIILRDDRLCLVNAWPAGRGEVLCCPGGGVELHEPLPRTLAREVHEETGMAVEVGVPVLVNEFHDPHGTYHQVEVFFRCTLLSDPPETWRDPEGVVTDIRWVTRAELATLPARPASLAAVAWDGAAMVYDPLEPLMR